MEDRKPTKMSKELAAKIIIPVLIFAVVLAIWFIKNTDKSPVITSDNPDFTLHATEGFDLEKLKSYGLPIMIDFGADYCEPCRRMAPVLEMLNKKLQGKAIIRYVDIEKYPELAEKYPISYIPTQVFFDKEGNPYTPSDPQALQMNMYSLKDSNEHVLTTHVGVMTEDMILAVLKEMGLEE